VRLHRQAVLVAAALLGCATVANAGSLADATQAEGSVGVTTALPAHGPDSRPGSLITAVRVTPDWAACL
jgi:hypothetical protein